VLRRGHYSDSIPLPLPASSQHKAAPASAVQAVRPVKFQVKKNPAEAGFFMKHQANYLD